MGQAKRRGSFEERAYESRHREQQRISAEKEARRLALQQERDRLDAAYSTMVWWQFDMSDAREARIKKRRHNSHLAMASIFDMVCGAGWGSAIPYYPPVRVMCLKKKRSTNERISV